MDFPQDSGGRPISLSPAKPALARTVDATISSSTEIVLQPATRIITVYAKSQDVYLKWGTTDVDATNFDEVIPAGSVIDRFVPIEVGTTRYTAINLIERDASASVIVIEK